MRFVSNSDLAWVELDHFSIVCQERNEVERARYGIDIAEIVWNMLADTYNMPFVKYDDGHCVRLCTLCVSLNSSGAHSCAAHLWCVDFIYSMNTIHIALFFVAMFMFCVGYSVIVCFQFFIFICCMVGMMTAHWCIYINMRKTTWIQPRTKIRTISFANINEKKWEKEEKKYSTKISEFFRNTIGNINVHMRPGRRHHSKAYIDMWMQRTAQTQRRIYYNGGRRW